MLSPLPPRPVVQVGGPLIPDLDTACVDYPHTIYKLDGSLQAREWQRSCCCCKLAMLAVGYGRDVSVRR